MRAFGFQTITVEDGNNIDSIAMAIEAAKQDTERPSFITIKTEIGYGCPAKQGKASAHGEPLGAENVKALRETLNWPYEEGILRTGGGLQDISTSCLTRRQRQKLHGM